MTVNIINDALEYDRPTPPAVEDRIGFYRRCTEIFGVAQARI